MQGGEGVAQWVLQLQCAYHPEEVLQVDGAE